MSNWTERIHLRATTLGNIVTGCGHSTSRQRYRPKRLEKVKFGVPLDEVCKNDIPGPLLVLILILNKEAPFAKNIFRAPGHQGSMKKLIHILQTGRLVNINNFSIYTIASVIKKFLCKIPGGIFGKEYEEQLFNIIQLENIEQQRDQIYTLINSLQLYTQRLLVLLFGTFRLIAVNSELAQTHMNSEALGVSVAPSFFHSCVSDGKTAKVEDVVRFKIATRVTKFLIDNFSVLNLFGKDNYEYYARITGRIMKVEKDWIFNFRYASDDPETKQGLSVETEKTRLQCECVKWGLKFNLDKILHQEQSQSTLALVHVPETMKLTSSLSMIPENILLENCKRLSVSVDEESFAQISSRSLSNSASSNSHLSKRSFSLTSTRLDELRAINRYAESTRNLTYMPQVHERQTERMRTRSEWFLSPVRGEMTGEPTTIHVLHNSNRSSSGNIGFCSTFPVQASSKPMSLSASAESIKRSSLRRKVSREKQRRSSSNKQNGFKNL
ncbi:uncharacterized protein LOC109860458 isoform X2 [Pseudomyrmex gracilis]|uniref:uncharacterized protein LOC109860458 isoform X2 n=1 Tax=Pseudomyrmex gracilis TaxID=219809 RepID=UPI0009955075|nr:uncharacterized protein LOC109860458 isoform X2 [Pseudomyrmex gracilis]